MSKPKKTKSLEIIAMHEASHAVMACEYDRPFKSVDIIPQKGRNGAVILGEPQWLADAPETEDMTDRQYRRFCQQMEKEAAIFLAGPCATLKLTGHWDYVASQVDHVNATYYLSHIYEPQQVPQILTRLTGEILDWMDNPDSLRKIKAVAKALLAKYSLTYAEVRELYLAA